jgi:hypothetical protein
MPWVKKIDLHTLLNQKRIRGLTVIHVDDDHERCTFCAKRGVDLVLGTDESVRFMQRKRAPRFTVGDFGGIAEAEYFLLVRDHNGIWYAYSEDCNEMFRITDLRMLDYKLVTTLIWEFIDRIAAIRRDEIAR